MFYKVNAGRVSLREFWWETKLFFWVGLIVKALNMRLRGSTDDLAVDSLRPFLIDQAQVPPDLLERFAPTLQTLRTLGFEPPVWHHEEDLFQATRNTLATLRHSSGRAWARVQCRVSLARVPAKIKFFTTFISRTPDGFIATGNGKYDMAWPKTHDTVRFRRMPVEEVWARHQQRMTASVKAIPQGQLLDAAEEYHATLRDFHLARGVFQPLSDEEYALYPAPAPAPAAQIIPPPLPPVPGAEAAMPGQFPSATAVTAPAAPPDLMELATLDELRQLQSKKINWRLTVGLLVLSAFLFILNSRGSNSGQSTEYVAIIVGVLLFHEMGHYLAMKIFGYRNLRMFFIPGFGAAVVGRHYNVPAWKKIIVSLMGPLPGIFAGTVLLILSAGLRQDLLYRIGLVAVIINAFNLIPILPFDGGWVAHAALFSRHPKLDVGFRLVAALLLILIGVTVPGTRFLPYVAVAGLLTLPMANRLAIIVSELRRVPGLGVSPDSQTIPPEIARVILARVRQRFTRNLNARLAAQHVASVFESLNARPPSVGATIGLISLHASGFLLALVVGITAIALHGRNSFPRKYVEPPAYVVAPDQIESNGPARRNPRNVLIARFKSEQEARTAFDSFQAARPVTRFGQTLLVDFLPTEAAAQSEVYNRYEKSADDVFVESDKMAANVELRFALPDADAGRQKLEDLRFYFQTPSWRLIPPWASDADWPAPQRESQTQRRRLVMLLQKPPTTGLEHQKQLRIQEQAADKRGDTAEAERLAAQAEQETADAENKLQQQLRQQFGQSDLIQKWAAIHRLKDFKQREERFKQEIAPILGQWPADKSSDILAIGGYAFDLPSAGPHINCQFVHTDTGLTAITQWLFSQGAANVRYRISSFRRIESDQDPEDFSD